MDRCLPVGRQVFTNQRYRDIVIESLKHCQKTKGLELYGFVIMSNHIHLIAMAKEGSRLSDILRDFKKHTSKAIIKSIQEDIESRREWMLNILKFAGKQNANNKTFQLWRNDNHPIELHDHQIAMQKLNYIHQNPVEAGIVMNPEEYIYSSAKNYSMDNNLTVIEVKCL